MSFQLANILKKNKTSVEIAYVGLKARYLRTRTLEKERKPGKFGVEKPQVRTCSNLSRNQKLRVGGV